MDSILQLLNDEILKQEREKYLELCMSNIKNKTSIPQSMYLAKNLFQILKSQSQNSWSSYERPSVSELVQKYASTVNLLEMCIHTFKEYLVAVKHEISKPAFKNCDCAQTIF